MNITVLTLFPDIVDGYFRNSIMGKTLEKGLITYTSVDIREFSSDKHHTCDDYPYGGGAGMVMKPEPLGGALDSVKTSGSRIIYPSPSGVPFDQQYAEDLARQEQDLVFICGRYEGIDQRVIDSYVTDELCIGDYVLSSGEIAALVIIDAVYRLIDGVISGESLSEESFSNGLLEYPHYTRPELWQGDQVPPVLLSGHHKKIEEWRKQKAIEKTMKNRPDLYEQYLKD